MAADGRSYSFLIKQKLMRAAWDGTSRFSGPEMIALILEHLQRARKMPQTHNRALAAIDDNEPRVVRALNLLEEWNGSPRRYTALLENMPSPSDLYH